MDWADYCRLASGEVLKETGVAFEHIRTVVN
jgi:hypothetical protein